MEMTQHELDTQKEISNIKNDLNALIVKMEMLNPVLFIEFKGTVIETLRTIDRDMTELEKNCMSFRSDLKDNTGDFAKFKIEIAEKMATLKTTTIMYGLLASGLLTVVLSLVLKHFIM